MDQFLLAMIVVIVFAVAVITCAAIYDRRNSDRYEPSEHGKWPL
jgi:heme/copper-type cytochrome/quinol oxidase subunit 2